MEKAFEFVRQLSPSIFDLLGYPTIELHSDYCEVKFKTSNVIFNKDFIIGNCYQEFRMFGIDDSIVFVFSFR